MNRSVINKWYAYGMMARIALHEASFRKYHDELGLQVSAEHFYKIAINACEKIMETHLFSIDKRGGIDNAYENLFISKYLQPIITQYFIDNKSEIWLLFLIAHSKR